MSLFDFVRDAGAKIFETDDQAAKRIKEHLDIQLSGIQNLDVQFDDGVATLCGDCLTQGIREQATLIAGNVKGVERVVADDLRVAPSTEPKAPVVEERVEFYTIVSGDTLGGIAKRYYGKASAYMRIFEANKGVIENPDRIYPGQKIRIPVD